MAYNNAMQPTGLVCSDGITLDSTPPTLAHVAVDHVYVRPGFAVASTLAGASLYLVRSDRTRLRIYMSGCAVVGTTARVDPYLDAIPIAREGNTSTPLRLTEEAEAAVCAQYGAVGAISMHYARGSRLAVSWAGGDEESGIRDYYVSVLPAAVINNPQAAPLKDPTETHARAAVVLQDVALEEGTVFYVRVLAVNNAGMQTALLAGPFEVDTLMPADVLARPIVLDPVVVDGALRVLVPINALPEGGTPDLSVALGVESDPVSVAAYAPVLTRDGRFALCHASGPSKSGMVSCPVLANVAALALHSSYIVSVRALYPNGQELVATAPYERAAADATTRHVCLHRGFDAPATTTGRCPAYLSVDVAPPDMDVSWTGFDALAAEQGFDVEV